MLTFVPLPRWGALLRALLPRRRCLTALAAPWLRDGEVAGWFSRSAWSLVWVVLWLQSRKGVNTVTLWVPDFFCNASLAPLRALKVQLVFYPITAELQPDYVACRKLAKIHLPDIFIFVHYFGCPVNAAPARDFCSQHGAWMIEDAAHILRPVAGVGQYGDFVAYSLHKLLPIPDGAVLVARSNGPGKLEADGLLELGEPETWASSLKEHDFDEVLVVRSHARLLPIWLVKRLLQKLGVGGRGQSGPFPELDHDVTPVKVVLPEPEMSGLAKRLLPVNLSEEARWRQRHQLLWDELLLTEPKAKLGAIKATERSRHREWSPYYSTYTVEPESAQSVYESMQRAGIPVVMGWPELPPEVCVDKEKHGEAWRLRHSQIHLPLLHQSLHHRDLLALMKQDAKRPDQSKEDIELKWGTATRDQWQEWMRQACRSNLLQSWAYGEAKTKVEGWRVHRGEFRVHGDPVAFVQVLEKRVAGVLRVFRMNRGPLFMANCGESIKAQILKILSDRFGNICRARIFSFAAELSLSGESILMLEQIGGRHFKSKNWGSAWIDLSKELHQLRVELDGKWRNMLSFAERKDICCEVDSGADSFEWITKKSQQLMQGRGGDSIPTSLYHEFQRELKKEGNPPLVFRALWNNKIVAGICVVPHGVVATYLMGWNGEQGRKLKANQFLLWQAITHLKQGGFRWFDLGGIDEENTPGISQFKLGMNGERYELVGESWKW